MGRLDWKRGRFTSDFETQEINHSLRGWQNTQVGDFVDYYRFRMDLSHKDDVYDEGQGAGRVYRPAVSLPCLHVTHNEGGNEDLDTGFYFNDALYVTASYDQVVRTGLTFPDIKTQDYLKDRIVYDTKVFRVTQVNVLGQIQERDVILSIEATQVKPDEMVNDPQWKSFSA